jgi:hypothetical protein
MPVVAKIGERGQQLRDNVGIGSGRRTGFQ